MARLWSTLPPDVSWDLDLARRELLGGAREPDARAATEAIATTDPGRDRPSSRPAGALRQTCGPALAVWRSPPRHGLRPRG